MEADLVPLYGEALPEDWREQRFPSFRRLLVIVRHLGPDSAVGRLDGHWPIEADLLDLIRRDQLAIAMAGAKTKQPYPKPHPDSREARHAAATAKAKAVKQAAKRAAADRREAERQARLTGSAARPG